MGIFWATFFQISSNLWTGLLVSISFGLSGCIHLTNLNLFETLKKDWEVFWNHYKKMSFQRRNHRFLKQADWKNSVDVDEVSIADHQNLSPLIETLFTEALMWEVQRFCRERCCGCNIDHPSQWRTLELVLWRSQGKRKWTCLGGIQWSITSIKIVP